MKLVNLEDLSSFTDVSDMHVIKQESSVLSRGSRMANSDELLELRLWKEWNEQSRVFNLVA